MAQNGCYSMRIKYTTRAAHDVIYSLNKYAIIVRDNFYASKLWFYCELA